MGTPSTGSLDFEATIPGRCAAPPAPAIIKLIPLLFDDSAKSNTKDMHRVIDVIEGMNSVIVGQLQSLEKFQIPYGDLILCKSDHLMWKKRLTELLLGRVNIKPEEVSDHHHCRLGKWYYGYGMDNYGSMNDFALLEEPHAKVHAIAREITELHHDGSNELALEKLNELAEYTEQVIGLLDSLRNDVLDGNKMHI